MKNSFWLCVFLIGAVASAAQPLAAKKAWSFKTTLGGTFNYTVNQSFVGTLNGQTVSPGLQLEQKMEFNREAHEWRTDLSLTESQTLSPPQTVFVKNTDVLQLKSSYLYHILDWYGLYASVKARTSVFPSQDLENGEQAYQITDAVSGQNEPTLGQAIKRGPGKNDTWTFPLASAFQPLVLEQDAGVFVQPYQRKNLLLEFRAGATARETISPDQLIILPYSAVLTPTNIPVLRLSNVFELGPSIGVQFSGNVLNNQISYSLAGDAMYAFLRTPNLKYSWENDNNPNNALSTFSDGRLSFDIAATVAFNLLSWLSINWTAKVILQPAMLDRLQFMSNIMLAVNYQL